MRTYNIKKQYYVIIAILIVIIWGSTFISTKVLLNKGLTPESLFFYRFTLAYIGMWLLKRESLFAKNLKDEILLLLLGITGGSFYFIAENYALKITLASNVSLIVCTAPLFTALLTHFILKTEKITSNLILGCIIALSGVGLVVFNGSYILKINPKGDALSLLAALLWAFYTIILKYISDNYSSSFITRKIFFYGMMTIIPVFIFQPMITNSDLLFQPIVLGNLLYLGIIASLACYFLWNLTVKELGAIQTTNFIYFIPIVTLIVSVLALPDEKITFMALIGAVLILTGIILSSKKNHFRKHAQTFKSDDLKQKK